MSLNKTSRSTLQTRFRLHTGRLFGVLLVAIATGAMLVPSIEAQTSNWTNTTGVPGPLLQSTGNWDTPGLPSSTETARFGQTGTYEVWWDAFTGASIFDVGSLQVADGNVTFLNKIPSNNRTLFIRGSSGSGSFSDLSISGINTNLTLNGITLRSFGVAEITNNATLVIDGSSSAESKLTVQGIGLKIDGTLDVSLGGIVDNTFARIGGSSSGAAVVSGPASQWNNSSSLHVGQNGNGSLDINSGGLVTSSNGRIGYSSLSTGTATINGSTSRWDNSGGMEIGYFGDGTLNIEAGGKVNNVGGFVVGNIGIFSDRNGAVNVTGFGSEWNVTAVGNTKSSINVGKSGNGTLNINSGGVVNSDFGFVGRESGSTGIVTVADSLSKWRMNDVLAVGGSNVAKGGMGALNIDSNGLVSVGDTTRIWSTGTVNLDGGRFEFGQTSLAEFEMINAVSGSMAGNVNHSGFTNVASTTGLQNTAVDLNDVKLVNTGTLYGDASLTSGLSNTTTGSVETLAGERMRFSGTANTNAGEINNLRGGIRFDQDMTNQSTGFIAGRGQFTANGGWTNEGVMAFSGGPADVLGDVVNQSGGQIVTTGGANTTFFDDVIHNGTEIRTAAGSNTAFLGAYSGAGSFTGTGSVFFEGDLRPGNSPDVINFEGNVILGSGSNSLFELAGLGLGEFDQLNIEGDLFLDGVLSVELLDGFQHQFGDEFLIADVGGTLLGQFNGLGEGALVGNYGGRDLFISYGAGDGNDVALFSAVPEPGSIAICVLGVVGVNLRRRRRS